MRKMHLSILALSLGLAFSAPAFAEPQPHMKAAIKHLEEAKTALEKATADKGGHRVKAIELVDQAIKEVKEGIEFDNKH